MKTFDGMAVEIILSGRNVDRRLAALSKLADASLHGGECPACGHPGPHDSNDDGSMFCCVACGEHFDSPACRDY